jgi:hypothetical protein
MDQEDPSGVMVYIAVPQTLQDEIKDLVSMATETPTFRNGEDFAADEREVYRRADRIGDKVVARRLQTVADMDEIRDAGRRLAKPEGQRQRVKDQGHRDVHIMTMRGGEITIRTSYFSRNCDLRRSRGSYPVLGLLGIYGCRRYYTPGLANHVVLLTTAMGSIDEAKGWLSELGISLCVETIQTMTYQYAQRVRASQKASSMKFDETLAGRRVVVSVDGGRIRVRRKKRGRKSKKGRTCYHAEWREPKLLMIYVVDASGRIDRAWNQVIDGLLKPHGEAADAIFRLMKYYLEELEIAKADTILFVADGARWIWARVQQLVNELGLRREQVLELVDFYHAVEHLRTVAELRRGWSTKQRKQWITKQRHGLRNGKTDEVIASIDQLCQGRLSKKFRTERDYFRRNDHRMRYRAIVRKHLPIGSGAIESAIRRVVNLRLKGAGIFWYEESANAMLVLRSYYKAGRMQQLATLALNQPLALAA